MLKENKQSDKLTARQVAIEYGIDMSLVDANLKKHQSRESVISIMPGLESCN